MSRDQGRILMSHHGKLLRLLSGPCVVDAAGCMLSPYYSFSETNGGVVGFWGTFGWIYSRNSSKRRVVWP